MRTLLRRLRMLARRRRYADELDEEMRLHLELRAAANRRHNADDPEARARRRFGSPLRLREESLDIWGFLSLDRFLHDVRNGLRQAIRQPAWSATVVLTLALGIGANTAVFTLLEAVLFKPAQAADPERLVWIAEHPARGGRVRNLSYPDYIAYRDRLTTTAGVLAYSGAEFSLGGRPAERLFGAIVSGNYFDVLGIRMAIGRGFTPDEDSVPGAHPVVILSHRLWETRFGADSAIPGRSVSINGRPFTVVGVAPPGFNGVELGEDAELWVPLAMQEQAMPSRPGFLASKRAGWLRVPARLRPGATAAQAASEARVVAASLYPPGTPPEDVLTAAVTPVRGGLDPANQDEIAPVLGLLSIVPFLVLLVACANVANVLLARNVGRRRELAMRRAIGATRGRLVRLLLTESLGLALAAGVVAVGFSFALTAIIVAAGQVPPELSSVLKPDLRVLVATTALAVLTTVLFGLAPALSGTRFDVLPVLKDEGGTSTAGGGRRRLRSAFVVAQMALSLVLLVTAGLFLGSLRKALSVDPGFDASHVSATSFDLALQGYAPARQTAFVRQAIDRAAALPGVRSVAITSVVPLSGIVVGSMVTTDGSTDASWSAVFSVSPNYFDTLGVRLLRGRDFTAADGMGSAPVAIVSESLARELWRGRDPMGQRLRTDDAVQTWRTVVGVVGDIKYGSLTDDASPALYLDERQAPASPLSLVVRTAGDPDGVLAPLSAEVRALDPDLPLFHVATMPEIIEGRVDRQRAASAFLIVFGALALVLAAVGIYGVTAHSASLRTREVGIRMALGARPVDVARVFLAEGLALGALGVVIGALVSAAVSQLLASFLFGLAPTDALTFCAAALLLGSVAVIASYLPARRASRVDPLIALRHQ